MSDKSEKPTAQKIRKAREQGDVPISTALVQSGGMVVALVLLPSAALGGFSRVQYLIRLAFGGEEINAYVLAVEVMTLAVPIIGGAAVGSFGVGYIQTGGLLTGAKLKFKLENLNPISGIKKLFKLDRLIQILRSLVMVVFVGYLCWDLIQENARSIVAATGDPGAALSLAGLLSKKLLWIAFVAGLVLAGVDVMMTRHSWEKRNMMSKDDVKREHKDSEGDPHLKGERKRAAQEMVEGASIGAVKDANVVVVNPTHLANALRYREEDDAAPTLVAKGEGEMAKRIIEAARAYGIPIVRDVPVARALAELEVGEEIPEVLYEAVAEILRSVWEEEHGAQDSDGAEAEAVNAGTALPPRLPQSY